jgi:hypothetical protein
MYLNSDTLDYTDGGTDFIKVKFNITSFDSVDHSYLISGVLCYSMSERPLNDTIGRIFLGDITTVRARNWTGFNETGLLNRKKQIHLSDKGEFLFSISAETKVNIIFTGFICNVLSYTISDILELSKK